MIIEARDDVVMLEGALERNLWLTIQAAANLLLRSHVQGIIIDGSALTCCSPEGAKTFRDAMNYIERYHARIVVSGLSDETIQTIKTIPGVRSRLPIAANLEEARISLKLTAPGKIPGAAHRAANILLPLLGTASPEAMLPLSCRLAKAEGPKAHVHLLYILEIPRALPLNAPLPEEEAIAAKVVGEAEAIVRRAGLTPVTHVTRARDIGEEIILQAERLGANILILTYAPSAQYDGQSMERITRNVLDRAPCEVILNKLAPVEA